MYFYWISFSSLEITPFSLFISAQSTIYSPRLLSFPSSAHLSALCHFPSSSSPCLLYRFLCLIPSILPFSFPSFLSYSILLALLCSLILTLVLLCPPSFLHSVLVFTAPPLTPAQFKYRGHFLPISPGARRAPRFAARRKVPVWAVVQWCHSNTNRAVNCFLWGGGTLKWLNRNWFSIQLRDHWCCHGNWHRHGTFRLLMQKYCHIGVLEIQLFGSAVLLIWVNHFRTLLLNKIMYVLPHCFRSCYCDSTMFGLGPLEMEIVNFTDVCRDWTLTAGKASLTSMTTLASSQLNHSC